MFANMVLDDFRDETVHRAPAGRRLLQNHGTFVRWVVTIGKFGVTDLFDVNQYAHDPQKDFLNWSAVDAGSFDYAADAWGFTVGAAVEWYQDAWTTRFGVFDLSTVPNSPHLDPGFHEFPLVAEVERRYTIADRPGKVMLTGFDSRGPWGCSTPRSISRRPRARRSTSARCGNIAAAWVPA